MAPSLGDEESDVLDVGLRGCRTVEHPEVLGRADSRALALATGVSAGSWRIGFQFGKKY